MPLTNSQYNKIMTDYEQKQLESRIQLQLKTKQIYSELPELRTYDASLAALAVEKARCLLLGNSNSALLDLKSEIASLSDHKRKLLASKGYSLSDLEPHYSCSLCQDTGYIQNKKCSCFTNAIVKLLYQQSNLQEILSRENFDNFNLSFYSPTLKDTKTGRTSLETIQNTLDICHNFVDTFGVKSNNLFFYGDTGIGKTFLSHCIAKELIERSYSVIYFSAFSLFETLAKGKFEKDYNSQNMNGYILDCDLLIVDDLGTELTNSFITSEFFHCIDYRLRNNKSTIISTNLSLHTLRDLYTERTFSRIASNYTMIRLIGDDIRLKKKLLNMED